MFDLSLIFNKHISLKILKSGFHFLGIVLITASFLVYKFSKHTFSECGGACDWWLDFIYPPRACVTVCIEKYYPHPIYKSLLLLGFVSLIVGTFSLMMKKRK